MTSDSRPPTRPRSAQDIISALRDGARNARAGWIPLTPEADGYPAPVDWLPSICCECLEPVHSRFNVKLTDRPSRLPIPICDTCRAKREAAKQRTFLLGYAVLLVVISIVWFIYREQAVSSNVVRAATLLSVGTMTLHGNIWIYGSAVQIFPKLRGPGTLWIRFRNRAFWPYVAEALEDRSRRRAGVGVAPKPLNEDIQTQFEAARKLTRSKPTLGRLDMPDSNHSDLGPK